MRGTVSKIGELAEIDRLVDALAVEIEFVSARANTLRAMSRYSVVNDAQNTLLLEFTTDISQECTIINKHCLRISGKTNPQQ